MYIWGRHTGTTQHVPFCTVSMNLLRRNVNIVWHVQKDVCRTLPLQWQEKVYPGNCIPLYALQCTSAYSFQTITWSTCVTNKPLQDILSQENNQQDSALKWSHSCSPWVDSQQFNSKLFMEKKNKLLTVTRVSSSYHLRYFTWSFFLPWSQYDHAKHQLHS